MVKEFEFEGVVSGDCECFCWDVTEEEYIRINGREDFERELKYRGASYTQRTMKACNPEYSEPWRIYPNDIMNKLGIETDDNVRLKISVV